MSKNKQAARLRQQAEELYTTKMTSGEEAFEKLSLKKCAKILHELQVYQIELSLQNEQLRAAQVELDTVRERYFDLYDLAQFGYVTLRAGLSFTKNQRVSWLHCLWKQRIPAN